MNSHANRLSSHILVLLLVLLVAGCASPAFPPVLQEVPSALPPTVTPAALPAPPATAVSGATVDALAVVKSIEPDQATFELNQGEGILAVERYLEIIDQYLESVPSRPECPKFSITASSDNNLVFTQTNPDAGLEADYGTAIDQLRAWGEATGFVSPDTNPCPSDKPNCKEVRPECWPSVSPVTADTPLFPLTARGEILKPDSTGKIPAESYSATDDGVIIDWEENAHAWSAQFYVDMIKQALTGPGSQAYCPSSSQNPTRIEISVDPVSDIVIDIIDPGGASNATESVLKFLGCTDCRIGPLCWGPVPTPIATP